MKKSIGIGCDHAGYELKLIVKNYLTDLGWLVEDFGTNSLESVDYPDFIHPLCNALENGNFDFGIIICGSGNGVAMTANKHNFIRAALCWQNEIAELSRLHNNANIISIPARFVSSELAIRMIGTFLNTKFEGGRHQRRVEKISC